MKIALLHGAKKNAGDFLILDRAENLLKYFYPDCQINKFYRNQSLEEYIEEINENDIMILAGGPAYNKDFMEKLAPMFNDINDVRIPIMCLGLGLFEYSSDDFIIYNHIFLDKTKELFQRAMEDSGFLGCRDYYSMHVLRTNGLSKTIMTGCPAWYDLDNVEKTEYSGVSLTEVRKICISDCGYEKNIFILCELLKFSRDFFGKDREIVFVVHRNDYYSENEEFLQMMKDLDIKVSVVSDSVEGLSVYDDCDLHIGFRVHAHIYNLSKRKMSILIEEDVRGQGVNDALGLPHIAVYDNVNKCPNQYVIVRLTNILMDFISQNYDKLNEAYRAMNSGFKHMKKHILSIENTIKNWKPKEVIKKVCSQESLPDMKKDECELWVESCCEMYDVGISSENIQARCQELQEGYDSMSEGDKKRVLKLLTAHCEPRKMVYLLSIIVRFMNVEGVRELLMRNLLKADYGWHEGTVLQFQLGGLNLDYIGLRRYRKQIVNKYREALNLNLSYLPVEERNSKRIVIVTDQVLSLLHAPTASLCDNLYVLQEMMGYEILVFCCPVNKHVDPMLWYDPNYTACLELFDNGAMKFVYKGAVFNGYQIKMDGDCLKEYHMMNRMIHMWNPICVLNLCNYNPIVDLINDYTTMISQRFSVGFPVSEADILLSFGACDDKKNLEYIERSNQILHELEIIKPHFERADIDYTREEFGLPEDKFIITIVGNRLDSEVKDDFINLMEEIANRYPEVVYAIIGDVKECRQKIDNTSIKDKTYYLGVRENLINVYEVMDLYLNPYRERGGYSGAMALVAGIPVITLPDCDVANAVIDELVVSDKEEIITTAGKYIHDTEFIKSQKDLIKRYNDENTKENELKKLQKRFEGIINLVK